MSTPDREREQEEERLPEDDGLRYPDARPFRQIQAVTAGLIGLLLVLTLLSDSRPSEVRWGTGVGLAVLAVAVLVIARRRKPRIPRGKR